jgi:hypothetical protein
MIILDNVLTEIQSQIAMHQPERGGALYGPKFQRAVTHFEYDKEGETSAVSYVPSLRLIENVKTVENHIGLQFKGIIHSHPRGFDRPSAGDLMAVQSFFRLNPHLSSMALPIVQQIHVPTEQQGLGFIHWFNAVKTLKPAELNPLSNGLQTAQTNIQIIAEDLFVIPLFKDVNSLVRALALKGVEFKITPKVQHLQIENAHLLGLVASNDDHQEFMFFLSLDYPLTSPIVLYQDNNQTKQLSFPWTGFDDKEASLNRMVDALLPTFHS